MTPVLCFLFVRLVSNICMYRLETAVEWEDFRGPRGRAARKRRFVRASLLLAWAPSIFCCSQIVKFLRGTTAGSGELAATPCGLLTTLMNTTSVPTCQQIFRIVGGVGDGLRRGKKEESFAAVGITARSCARRAVLGAHCGGRYIGGRSKRRPYEVKGKVNGGDAGGICNLTATRGYLWSC
jgi:hypothetical protein